MQHLASSLRAYVSRTVQRRYCPAFAAAYSRSGVLKDVHPYTIQRRLIASAAEIGRTLQSYDALSEISNEEKSEVNHKQAEAQGPTALPRPFSLPQSCPGCGALAQESSTTSPGFYSKTRKAVRQYIKAHRDQDESQSATVEASLETTETPKEDDSSTIPICDRCHDLIYNSRGQSIAHPSIDDIADSIAESPFKRNHVYHVLDAADFPMSLVPSIFQKLSLAKPRSRNRRSQHDFSSKPTLSFIITRSDLLGPTKEIVDGMMPYFQTVLRDALGRAGSDLRLGNVHLVSAKRGWWTNSIKESIWKRGGGNWLVGRVNVGKSNLFEVLFPKGSERRGLLGLEVPKEQPPAGAVPALKTNPPLEMLSETSLLPPAQPERQYPVFPVVSSLPGTTASPIRLPFGRSRGELIDLPGVERDTLDYYVQKVHQPDLIMAHRHKVQQHVIKPGQSLILGGGLVRITPKLDPCDQSTTVLAYPFLPLDAHVTSTEKASGEQLQQRHSGIKSILAEGAGSHMASAGVYHLDTDATRSRAGPMLRAGVSLSRLPFCVWATDILVEGVGWVELVCQTRKQPRTEREALITVEDQQMDQTENAIDSGIDGSREVSPAFQPFAGSTEITTNAKSNGLPAVEVFSPNGRHVSQRRSLEAWARWTEARNTREVRAKSGRARRAKA